MVDKVPTNSAKHGYLVTLVGAFVPIAVATAASVLIGLYSNAHAAQFELGVGLFFLLIVLMVILAIFIGSPLGAYIALNSKHYNKAGRTAWTLFAILIVAAILGSALQKMALANAILSIIVLASPLLARYLAIR